MRGGGGRQPHDNRTLIPSLVFGLMLVNNASVIIGRYTRLAPPEEQFDTGHLVFVTEVVKLLFSCIGEHIHTSMGDNGMGLLHSLKANIWDRPLLETLKLAIPAALFLIQNSFFYVALSNLSAPVFQVTYQGKLLTTALVSVVMLGRKYSIQKWSCLVLLSLGVSLAVISEKKTTSATRTNQSVALGLTAIAICSLCGALAGVYFERILKNKNNNTQQPSASLWLRNVQLSFFSILLAFLQKLFSSLNNSATTRIEATTSKPYFHGFTVLVCTLVVLRASAGLLGGLIIKHADNVIKGISHGVSVVLGCFVSTILFGTPVTTEFVLGAALVLTSCYFFSNPLKCSSSESGGFFVPIKSLCHLVTAMIFMSVTLQFSILCGLDVFQNSSQYLDGMLSSLTTEWNQTSLLGLSSWPPGIKLNQTYLLLEFGSSPPDIKSNQPSLVNIASSPPNTKWNQTTSSQPFVDLSGPPKDSIRFHIVTANCPDCGGCLVSNALAPAIRRLGYDAYGKSNTCPKNYTGNLVIIYPEGFRYRCNGRKNVLHIHWMLAPMGKFSAPHYTINKWWKPDDLIFHYGGDKGNMQTKIPVPHTNTLTIAVNPEPGDDTDSTVLQALPPTNRSGVAVIMQKGAKFHPEIKRALKGKSTLPHETLSLGTVQKFESHHDLRQYEYCFSYDPYTFWSLKAAMLGTVSILYPVQNRSKEEWVKGQYVGSYLLSNNLPLDLPGIAYGFEQEEIDYARATMHQLRPLLVAAKEWGSTFTVMRMIRDSYQWLNGEREHFEGAVLAGDFYHFRNR